MGPLRPRYLVRDWPVPDLGWRLRAVPVQGLGDALALGRARNACLDGLTGDQTPVSPEAQEKWFRGWKPMEHLAYLYYRDSPSLVVGWSHIHFRPSADDDRRIVAWPSLGVLPDWRGQGYGREIVQHTMIACGGPAEGLMLARNKTIQKIDFELGWQEDYAYINDRGEKVLVVSYPWPPPFLQETP